VAVPAAQAFVAFADGNYREAAELLGPVREQMQSIGGSHAQRDLFEQVFIQSLLRSGQYEPALAHLEKRAAARPQVRLDRSLLQQATEMAAS
jgi:hypothetical protein